MSADLIGLPDSPFLTMAEGARYARFDDCADPVRAFQRWLRRQAIPVAQGRGKNLIDRAVLVAAMRHKRKGA